MGWCTCMIEYFNFGFLLLHVVLTLWWSDIKHPRLHNTTPIDLSTRFQNLRELMMEATDAVVAVPFYFHIFQQYGTKSNPHFRYCTYVYVPPISIDHQQLLYMCQILQLHVPRPFCDRKSKCGIVNVCLLFSRFTANMIQCLDSRIIFIGIWCLSIMLF